MLVADGYSDVPAGKIASVVTCLEMREPPAPSAERADELWQFRRVPQPDSAWYRDLFARVGTEWLWFSRIVMPVAELEAILSNPAVEVYALSIAGRDEGLLELNFRESGTCELAFLGLTSAVHGRGAGRFLMNRALELAWAHPIKRLWVHTCTLDHPAALSFYLRSGFRAYARRVEVEDDPRLTGVAPRTAAAHVPVIGSPR